MASKKFLRTIFLTSILLVFSLVNGDDDERKTDLPPGFMIGAATSSYQIEGGWNANDKGENSWDFYTHNRTERISDRGTGDIACDSYHKYKEDAQLIQDIGLDFYRFSLSWARILPNGYSNYVSDAGVKYYNDVLDELEKRNITPMVTIYHWDHPQKFQFMGGWTNDIMVDLYTDYAKVVFDKFAHRVKHWITINEPNAICRYSYVFGLHAPGYQLGNGAGYLCNTNVLKAHARVYHLYNKDYKPTHNGEVGITLELRNFFPKNKGDDFSAEKGFQVQFGIYAHPIFSKNGNWPQLIIDTVGNISKLEGLPRSRLPVLSEEWIAEIKGSADFLGLNHYTSMLVEPETLDGDQTPSDDGLSASYDPNWEDTAFDWLKIVPEGFANALKRLKNEYDNPKVYVTENGAADDGKTVEDNVRLVYLSKYMQAMLDSIYKDGCNVHGYAIWSLLDNFEWSEGYNIKFGLYQVNFTSPERTRTAKQSAKWLKEVIKARKLLPIDPYLGIVPAGAVPNLEWHGHTPKHTTIWYRGH
ncbi:myrosinase 1-like [Phymastichus coffea]|uniref:myrosinase 1-like n=1 Tax=Phymastichus coffea TaxID=108790 RepID=UPI00273A828F|nr:myrosinase 1-like [Phymastichus coffea]